MTDPPPSSPTPLQEALLLASLADGRSRLTTAHIDTSTWLLIENLLALGATIVVDEATGAIDVAGTGGYWPNSDAELACRDDFLVTCMLLAAGSIGHGQYTVTCTLPADDDLSLTAMIDALRDLGAAVNHECCDHTHTVNLGPTPIRGGSTQLRDACPASVIASMLMVAPYAVTDVFIRTMAPGSATKAIGIALALVDQFGASVVSEPPHFIIPAPQRYRGRDLTF